jgi:hypothetical protein
MGGGGFNECGHTGSPNSLILDARSGLFHESYGVEYLDWLNKQRFASRLA